MSPSQTLDAHLREIIRWHFSPETACPFWLEWMKQAGWNPVDKIRTFNGLAAFPHFHDDHLRDQPPEAWVPAPFRARPFNIFETGGTTGAPKQRIGWDDYKTDYEEFSARLPDNAFPKGAHWLMLGPTGPRRLRLAIEHLANFRGGACYFLDLDPRWVKKLLAAGQSDIARQYLDHVIEQAVSLLQHRKISCLFATPKLLEALGEKINIPDAGIKGVFCGGTSMTPQVIRFLVEETLQNRVTLIPTYGNTLMGLAVAKPVSPSDGYALTYYAPQPRAVLRVVNPHKPDELVPYNQWGRVELTTLTKEFFMPRFLERDEALRRQPCDQYPWDGVGDVRPFGAMEKQVVEGVY